MPGIVLNIHIILELGIAIPCLLSLQEGKSLAPNHRAGEWQSWDSKEPSRGRPSMHPLLLHLSFATALYPPIQSASHLPFPRFHLSYGPLKGHLF